MAKRQRPTKEELYHRMMGADRRHVGGELAFALARSQFPLPLAMQLLKCSRGTLYNWINGMRPKQAYHNLVRQLINCIEVAIYHRHLPARTNERVMQSLLQAKQLIKTDPAYVTRVLNARDSTYPVHYNSATASAQNNTVPPIAETTNDSDRFFAENMAPER